MANILLCVPVNSDNDHVYDRVIQLTQEDSHKIHHIVKDPNEADIIIFVSIVSPYFEKIRKDPIYKKYKSKCFVISDRDRFIPFLPGLYASIEMKMLDPLKYSGWAYLGIYDKEYIGYRDNFDEAKIFFSFAGSPKSHPVRKKLLELSHPRAEIINTEKNRDAVRNNNLSIDEYRRNYVELLSRSKFVLCPRGFGTSSFRLYETMIVGRVPVIISDGLVLPEGPDWNSFSVRVKEKDVEKIPDILADYEPHFKEMGMKARSEWDKWFSTPNFLHNAIEKCLELKKNPDHMVGSQIYLQFLKPYHLARYLKKKTQNILNPNNARYEILDIKKH